MAGDDGVNSRQEAAKLVADVMEIGMADAAEQDLDLHVVFGWIASRDRGGGQRRRRTGSGISFGLEHGIILLLVSFVGFRFCAESGLISFVGNLSSSGVIGKDGRVA
jgi:energy-converting hydrogenase Eha subunit B